VILVSVDGLRADILANLMADDTVGDFANFQRLVDEGATTFNARTDYTHTLTIPNHTCMLTSRPVSQPAGQPNTVHHGYTANTDPQPGDTLHNSGNPNVDYVASAFDVAHDYGLSTALFASKSKFILFDQSYDTLAGAPDQVAPDHGPDKIDTYTYLRTGSPSNASNLHSALIVHLAATPSRFTFVHYRDPDSAGHASGWGSAVWNDAVRSIDDYLGDILNLVATSEMYQGRTTVIVTADHGGSGTGHYDPANPQINTIPFMVWGAQVTPGADLYSLNAANRLDPGTGWPDYNALDQPIRNGDSGNLALALLGLPAIAGSTINSRQDLAVSQPLAFVAEVPRRSADMALYPNPANPATTIDFTLAAAGHTRLALFTIDGRRVKTLADRTYETGRHSVTLRDPNLSSGVYLVHLEAPGVTESKKLLLLK